MGEYAYICEDCRWTAAFDGGCERELLDAALSHFERTGHAVERVSDEPVDPVDVATETESSVDDTADT